MARSRTVPREVEAEAAAGDLEAAARLAYERHLARAVPEVAGIGSVARNTALGFVIGRAAGFLTLGIAEPGGTLAGVALAVVPGAVAAVRDVYQEPRTRGRVTATRSPGA
jgi:hypothetical protein